MHWTHAIWIWDPCAAARHTQNTRLIWSSTLLWVQLDTLASQSIAMQYSRHWTPLKGFWWGLIYHRQYQGSSQDVPRHLFLLKHSSDGPSSSRMPPQELHKDQQCFPAHLTHESKIACMACTYGILRNGVQSKFFEHTSKSRVQRNRLEEAGYSRRAFPSILLVFELTRLDCVQAILSQHNKRRFALDADKWQHEHGSKLPHQWPDWCHLHPKFLRSQREWQATQQTGWCRKHQ